MSNIQPITLERHTTKRWLRYPDFGFTAGESFSALAIHELPLALMGLPIGFIEDGSGGYILVAIQGLEPGRNLFVGPNRHWRGVYIPEAYRRYPFVTASTEDGTQLLCVDEDSDLVIDGTEGERFFEEDGEPSKSLVSIQKHMTQYAVNRQTSIRFCKKFVEHKLIKPWEIKIPVEDVVQNIEGYFCIDEDALNSANADTLVDLRDSGALGAAYCQLVSMIHLRALAKLAQKGPSDSTPELNFDELDAGGSLNFDNL